VFTYYGREWLDECARRINTSGRHLNTARRLDGRFCFRLYDGPDGKDRTAIWEFHQGTCTRIDFEARRAPWRELRQAEFDPSWIGRFSCSFDMMKKINRGELSPARALVSLDYKVEGKKFLMAWLLPAINSWNQINASVPCVYEFSSTDEDGNAVGTPTPAYAESSTRSKPTQPAPASS